MPISVSAAQEQYNNPLSIIVGENIILAITVLLYFPACPWELNPLRLNQANEGGHLPDAWALTLTIGKRGTTPMEHVVGSVV